MSGFILTSSGGGGGGGSPTGSASGDLGGNYPGPTVVNIHGASVPVAGSLTTGNTLQVSGSSALTYGSLNLAGGSNYVSGVLPAGNQAAQTLGGDLSGTTASGTVIKLQGRAVSSTAPTDGYVLTYVSANSDWEPKPAGSSSFTAAGDLSGSSLTQTVISIHGATVPIAGSLTTGNGLHVTGSSTLSYSALNLAGGSNYVTGILPNSNQAAQSLSGDLSGNTGAATVIKLQGRAVSTNAPSDGYVLTYVTANSDWEPKATTTFTAAGDLSGSSSTQTVIKINGSSVPAGGSLTTGNGLYATASSTLAYSALNLAGGTGFVTGLLPSANQSAQTLGGDLSGTTTSGTVTKINGSTVPAGGSLVTGNSLRVTGTSALGYSALNLAGGTGFITGILPTANQAAQTMGGDITGTTGASLISSITGSGGFIPFNATIVGNSTSSSPVSYGAVTVSLSSDADYTLTSSQLVIPILKFTSTVSLTTTRNIILPASTGAIYYVYNNTTGAQSLIFKASSSAGVTIGNGFKGTIYYDGSAYVLSNGALNLAGGSNYVAGLLPTANQVAQSLGGDLSGTTASGTVIKLQGNAVSATTPSDGYLLAWSAGGSNWGPSGATLNGQHMLTLGGVPQWGAVSCIATSSVNFPASGNTDGYIYTVPVNSKVIVTGVWAVITTALSGTGSIAISAGTSPGDISYLQSKTITNANTAFSKTYGLSSSGDAGTALLADNGYAADLLAGSQIGTRLTATGTVSGGTVKFYVMGIVLN